MLGDVLKQIRRHEVDYCFSVGHIAELLRYERERLRAEWLPKDEMYKVWLADD